MLISYRWIKEYLSRVPKPKKLADILNRGAFEIEGLEQKKNDWILDVDILPNRAHDALSHKGMAKEVATLTGVKFIEKQIDEIKLAGKGEVKVKVQEDFCRRYVAREIHNIEVRESPQEIKDKLETIGQKSINNIVDITNLVMFDFGQPMHAFDLNKMSGDTLVIREARDGEQLTTLDNQEVNLQLGDPVIADADSVLAIAGVKGGKKAEVDSNTKDIVLESANFLPAKVRKTSRKIGIATESSKRFENEITPELADKAVTMATNLILKYASSRDTKVYESVDVYPKLYRPYQTGVSVDEINSLLGLKLNERKVSKVLNALKFQYEIINPRERVVEEVKKLVGKPYKLSASVFFDSPREFDCSSLVAYVYSLAGFSIPRISIDQFVAGEEISEKELRLGDLVFGNSGEGNIRYESQEFLKGTRIPEGVDHVGIYLGNDEVVHASGYNESGVEITKISNHPSFKKVIGYARYMDGDRRFAVTVPVERLDVKSTIELIEEIGRVYGYGKIKDRPIEMKGFKAEVNKEYTCNNLIRNILTNLGFSEIITHSFVNTGELQPEKPIAEDKAYLRPSLEMGMEDALDRNIKNADLLGLDTIKMFEIGRVFLKESEKTMLSIGVVNKGGVKKSKTEDIIRETITQLSEVLKCEMRVDVKDGDTVVQINLNEIYDHFENPKKYLDLPVIENKIYNHISSYPFILRDIAVWIPAETDPEKLLDLIKKESGDLLVNVKLFDRYEKENRISYAYRLVFQSHEKTLTDEEINPVMDSINDKVAVKNWEVR